MPDSDGGAMCWRSHKIYPLNSARNPFHVLPSLPDIVKNKGERLSKGISVLKSNSAADTNGVYL